MEKGNFFTAALKWLCCRVFNTKGMRLMGRNSFVDSWPCLFAFGIVRSHLFRSAIRHNPCLQEQNWYCDGWVRRFICGEAVYNATNLTGAGGEMRLSEDSVQEPSHLYHGSYVSLPESFHSRRFADAFYSVTKIQNNRFLAIPMSHFLPLHTVLVWIPDWTVPSRR